MSLTPTPARDDARYLGIDELMPRVDVAAYWEFDSPQWHRYGLPGHHLLLLVEGSIRAITPDGTWSAGPGELACFRPTPLNQYGNDTALRYYQIHVDFAAPPRHLCTPWFDGLGALPSRVVLGARFARMRELFEAICVALVGPSAGERLRVHAAVVEILALIAETMTSSPEQVSSLDPWQRMRMRLEGRLEIDVSIAQLAREMELSEDHFIRRFQQRFGVSPKLYRTQARLRWALQRLRAGEGPIKTIARAIGMTDATAFTRLFRRHFGITPSAALNEKAKKTDGAALTETPLAQLRESLVPVNRHLLEPHHDSRWIERFRPPE